MWLPTPSEVVGKLALPWMSSVTVPRLVPVGELSRKLTVPVGVPVEPAVAAETVAEKITWPPSVVVFVSAETLTLTVS